MFVPAYIWVNWIGSDFLELLSLLVVPVTVKFMFPERTVVTIHLVITFTISTACLLEFWVLGVSFWSWTYNTKLCSYDVLVYVVCYTSDIWCHTCSIWMWYVSTFSNFCTGFMLVLQIIVIWLPMLKHLLISIFVLEPFWEFQIST